MAHSNFSPEINETLVAAANASGFSLKDVSPGTIVDIRTKDVWLALTVIDAEKGEVALETTLAEAKGPDIWVLLGSGWGGSMMKLGWIGIGAQMRLRRLAGGILETAPVKTFICKNDPVVAQKMVSKAEANRPKMMTEEEKKKYETNFAEALQELLEKEFLDETLRERAREMVEHFGNLPAKATVLGVLSQAQKHNKLERAFALLEQDWTTHWSYQPKFAAGDPEFLPMNARRWEALYHELGVPTPSQDESTS